ncbi:FadR/GntR family transcriptional regulator [Variovorax rhizosphaerae]|uniref:GntR family transcriptional regulator n=1 Tax=Variovorax rhizosphaerae TaxID=1836200 RepID=A0ABU8WUX5_9BURK
MNENSTLSAFKPVRRRTFEDVTSQIREQIAQGALREGDRLPAERVLAETLGVSRNTVREALRSLEYAGLLTQKPGASGGAYIASGGVDVIRSAFDDLMSLGTIRAPDLIEARIVIGREVARLACERHDATDLAALVDNVEKTHKAAEAGDLPLRVRYSLEFHKLMALAAKNPVLTIMTNVLTDTTMKFVKAIGEMPNDFVLASRKRMLEHLRHRNADMAADEADAYLRTTLRSYLRDAQLPPVGR